MVSASITINVSLGPSPSSTCGRAWLRPPAFLLVLSTVSKTSTPAPRAMDTVWSEQLSATTTIRRGWCDWSRSDLMVSAMQPASLWAGISTVTVTGPSKTPRVSAITPRGASGIRWRSSLARDAVVTRRSTSATNAASSSPNPAAATTTAIGGVAEL